MDIALVINNERMNRAPRFFRWYCGWKNRPIRMVACPGLLPESLQGLGA